MRGDNKLTVAATANQSSSFNVLTMCSLVPDRARAARITTTRKNHDRIWISGDLLESVISTCVCAMIAISAFPSRMVRRLSSGIYKIQMADMYQDIPIAGGKGE